MKNEFDVFEILNEKEKNAKLDVFEILNEKSKDDQKDDQEHCHAPDFDLSDKKRSFPVKPFIRIAVIAIVVLLALNYCFALLKVGADSMSPAVSDGDRVIALKHTKSYKEGDVILFRIDRGPAYAARIVASYGDVVDITGDGNLYVNRKLMEEEYAAGKTEITDTSVQYPVLVGENEYFVLGDNRENSVDSRNIQIGLVESGDIIGKVILH